jgi:hypothetical protein
LRAALKQGAIDLGGVSQADIAKTVKAYRRERRKPELMVVAEAVEATAQTRARTPRPRRTRLVIRKK